MDKGLKERLAFDFEEGCKIVVDRVPGTNDAQVFVDFSSTCAALKGVGFVIAELAEMLNVPVHIILCKLATVLLAQTPGEELPENAVGE